MGAEVTDPLRKEPPYESGDYIRWYEIQVYQRVWKADIKTQEMYPQIWVGGSEEFGNMVSVSAMELEFAADDDMMWEFITKETDRQMDEAIRVWAGDSAYIVAPREWTCRPFWSSEWDYLKRKGLVTEQD